MQKSFKCAIISIDLKRKVKIVLRSKKQRLKEQSLKQIEEKKKIEKEEQELKDKAKANDDLSLSSVKLLKKEPVYCLVLKILAVGVYIYTCFYYGGVTIIGIFTEQVHEVPKKYAVYMLIGVVVLLAALLMMFFKKYIVSFVLNVIGTILYMKTAVFLVETVRRMLNDNYITDPDIQKLDKTYIYRHYPEFAFLGLGFVLLAISIVRRYLKYRKIKAERDNAPVKSIIED